MEWGAFLADACRDGRARWPGDFVEGRGAATGLLLAAGAGVRWESSGERKAVSRTVDGRLRAFGVPESSAARAWERGSSREDSANATSSESTGEGALGGEASAAAALSGATPSGEVKRFAARAWRANSSTSSDVFLRIVRSASSFAVWRRLPAGVFLGPAAASCAIFSLRRPASARWRVAASSNACSSRIRAWRWPG